MKTCGTYPGGSTIRTSACPRYQAAVPLQPRETLPVMDLRPWFVKVLAATFVPLRYNPTVSLKVGMALEHLIVATLVTFLGWVADGRPIRSPPVTLQVMAPWAGAVASSTWFADKAPGAGVALVDACAVASDPALRAAATATATTAVLMNFTVPPLMARKIRASRRTTPVPSMKMGRRHRAGAAENWSGAPETEPTRIIHHAHLKRKLA